LKYAQTTFYDHLTLTHEFGHITLADTPTKMFARHISAWAYSYLNFLLNEKSWNEVIWDEIEKLNKHLTTICEAITLSEELLASAMSVEDVTNCYREHAEKFVELAQIELEILEEKSINKYQKLFSVPDFAGLYYNTFKKIAAWVHSTSGLLPLVSCYLQGIQQLSPDFVVVDSYNRCKVLGEKVKDLKNGVELANWIRQGVLRPKIWTQNSWFLVNNLALLG
jgi:hypothetical protein